MTQLDFATKRAEVTEPPTPPMPIVPSLIGFGLWALVLVALAITVYLDPIIAAIGLASITGCAVLAWLVWQHPEVGLVILIFMLAGFIPSNIVDLRLPIGGLDLRDLCLLGLVGMLALRQMIRAQPLIPWPEVSIPLIVFLTLALCSTAYAIHYMGVEAHWSFDELRTLAYYSIFFAAAWAIERPRQLVVLLVGLFIIADLVTAIIFLQQFLGTNNHLLAAMTGNLWYIRQEGTDPTAFGAVRIVPPIHVLIFILSIVSFSFMVSARHSQRIRIAFALQFAYLNFGLLITYTRAQWIASAIAIMLITIFLHSADRLRLLQQLLIAGVVMLIAYGLFGTELLHQVNDTKFVAAVSDRVLSIFSPQDTLETSSLEWRVYENGEVFKSLSQHPLLGVGLGNSYRNVTLLSGEARGWWGTLASGRYGSFTRYVHNSYLYIAVKMGILGLLAWIWLCLAFLAGTWRVYRAMEHSEYKRVTLALLMSFVGIMSWSITHAHFMRIDSALVIGVMFGVVASIQHIAGVRVGPRAVAPKWEA